MESAWLSPSLSSEILTDEKLFTQIHSVVADILSERLTILKLVENMRGALTSTIAENREKGIYFLTAILKNLPKDYLDKIQIKFLSNFYVQRLGDQHKMLPHIIEGYLVLVNMRNYETELCQFFFTELFKEVSCQMQSRQERFKIYQIIQQLVKSDPEYMKTLGIDFPCGVIQAIDGERDPRNLLFLFNFLPHFIKNIPLGHMVQEMFGVISCYFPIDFYPKKDDPAAVTRQDLADALAPCLYAIPEFADQCLVLLIEKLDSSLRIANLDSLKLLADSCQTFPATAYLPFLKTLWSLLHKDLMHKTDADLKMAAHRALSAIVFKTSSTSSTDRTFETFIEGVLISMQQSIAEAKTVTAYTEATKILSTIANSSRESCIVVTKAMIPATIAFYELNNTMKLHLAAIDYLGDLYEMVKYWDVKDDVKTQIELIPKQCLIAVSNPQKEYQMTGFITLMTVVDILQNDLVCPFVEILTHLIQHATDEDLLSITLSTVHAIARKYPELIMDLVVIQKCNLDQVTEDPHHLKKRLKLLCGLASIDKFTTIIIEQMLKLIDNNDEDALKVVEALSESVSNTSLYTEQKIIAIDSDHGIVNSMLAWLLKEVKQNTPESLTHAYSLITNTMCCLPVEKQEKIIKNHTSELLKLCKKDEMFFPVLESLFIGLHQSVHDDSFTDVLSLSLNISLKSENEKTRLKASALSAHILNKATVGPKFDCLYEYLKNYLTLCSRDKDEIELCQRLIAMYGWITKALILRGSDLFKFWLRKLIVSLYDKYYCEEASQSIGVIVNDQPGYFTSRIHCNVSILYKQRMYESFSKMVDGIEEIAPVTKEHYLLSWAYVCAKTPRSVLKGDVAKIMPLIIESMQFANKTLLVEMLDLLTLYVKGSPAHIADSLQTIVPRVLALTRSSFMDARIKSLECLFEIANAYQTSLTLPYKQEVLEFLLPALDDKKRLVRNAAVKARTRWYLVGAPGEPSSED